ncbi:TPA: HAD family hydrolase [Vibrio cholerae]|uniref:HAD family hydrolase n=1 Tax=Vibrio cholerae TaxID=666 RepID=UPI001D624FC1|nr:HAD family phosphatase [Vibrio cholerae]EGR1041122.1 HAD family phosphatase [Vibrio cholerae]EGR2441418.1 HAD family phosphatase [Vibrio cholerae]EGR4195173.1 HAD family phosphatase [Vibrio cholerae]EJL6636479.1 HAD family phosphatase [Vibrio cholerae]
MTKKIKAVIFDMDGVLIDAKDWHYEALNKALAIFGLEINRYDHLVTFDGLSTNQKLNILSKTHVLPESLHPFINEMKQQYTMDITHQLCKPTFNHQFALSKLRQEGYKLAVASNSIRNTVKVMMEKSSLAEYLDFYLSNQDVTKGKPDPEIYQLAIKKLGLEPSEVVIVEDNENGLKAAKASGANVLKIETVHDVTFENIKNFITEVEGND